MIGIDGYNRRMAEPTNDDIAAGEDTTVRDVLEAFNAEELADRPGEPPTPELSDASETDAPPPG